LSHIVYLVSPYLLNSLSFNRSDQELWETLSVLQKHLNLVLMEGQNMHWRPVKLRSVRLLFVLDISLELKAAIGILRFLCLGTSFGNTDECLWWLLM